jgi:AraC-like DNA-binding protein
MAAAAQWVRIYRLGGPYCAEIVHAHYVQHRFARHAHEHFVIGLVANGVQQYSYRGARHTTPAGQVFFVNGAEPHTGEPATADGYLYRTLCLSSEVFRQLASDITNKNAMPYLEGAVVADDQLATKLRRFHSAVAANAPAIERDFFLLAVVRYLIQTHTRDRNQAPAAGNESCVAKQIREFLEAHYSENVSLARLGRLTSRSPFHVARLFSKEIGLPPHAYLESVRIRHARELLRSGVTVVDTALSVGYPDQSHFTHRFRRLTGFTPGQFQASAR